MKANDRIRNRRLELGLTLEQVGDYVGVSKSTVRKWETGFISNMRRDKIAKLAHILKLSPLELVDDPESAFELHQIQVKKGAEVIGLTVSDTDPQIDELLGFADQLNAKGKERLCRYAEELTLISTYQKKKSSTPDDAEDEYEMVARGGKVVKPDKPFDADAFTKALDGVEQTDNL